MLKKLPLLLVFIAQLSFFSLEAQISIADSFSDSDFVQNPKWFGDTSKFEVNANYQLKLNDTQANSPAALYLASNIINKASWEFWVQLDFAPSASNYAKVYLVSDTNDLKGNLSGYFVQIGGVSGTVDDISLYRQDGSSSQIIIDGVDGTVGISPAMSKIKVTKDSLGEWELLIDTSKAGNNYVSQGKVKDKTYVKSFYFGILCNYTTTRSDKFLFDDFLLNGYAFKDTIPPKIDSIRRIDSNEISIYFSENLETTSALNKNNYFLDKGIGNPTNVSFINNDSSQVQIQFYKNFVNGEKYLLKVGNVNDRDQNSMLKDSISFLYFIKVAASPRDVQLNEFYPDFKSSNGLPSAEFVELFNASQKILDLNGWQISDITSTATFPSHLFRQGEYVIICSQKDSADFSVYGTVVAVKSLPTLNNSGDYLALKDADQQLIDEVSYDLGWYQDKNKQAGGWTIEQINPFTPCNGTGNFRAAIDPNGGTPGTQNSIYSIVPDTIPPQLVRANVLSADSILLYFNELIDSTSTTTADYQFNTKAVVGNAYNRPPGYQSILLTLSVSLDSDFVNTLTVTGIKDCPGNVIDSVNTADLVLPVTPNYRDIVINELYANEIPSNGLPEAEFVELFNASQKFFDLENWQITDITSTATFPSHLFRPGEYVIICSQKDSADFSVYGTVVTVKSLPTLNNSGDYLGLKDANQKLIDELNYDLSWYQDKNKQAGGWTIEQINPFTPCTGAGNFRAAIDPNGGTPGTQNSIYSIVPDTIPPQLVRAKVLSADSILLYFNELIDSISTTTADYQFNTKAVVGNAYNRFPNYQSILLTLSISLDSGFINTLTVTDLKDCAGNIIDTANTADLVVPGIPNYRDIVINEIYADENPSIGLPEAEFIEIYNASNKIFDLKDWTIADASTQSRLESYILKSGEYLIICPMGNSAIYNTFGPTQGQNSFPSLGNSGDEIFLKSPKGELIDYVKYTDKWYQNEEKSSGGWTLEQINPFKECSGVWNFSSSVAALGGTPGQQNSIYSTAADKTPPQLKEVLVKAADQLTLIFNEGMDSLSLKTNDFTFSNGIKVIRITAKPLASNEFDLFLNQSLDSGKVVEIQLQNISDCDGNRIDSTTIIKVVLPQTASKNDLVINEILFNPFVGSYDFVEIYNRSEKIISLQNWQIANGKDGLVDQKEIILSKAYPVYPGDYVVLTENTASVAYHYPRSVVNNFIEVQKLPSYNNDFGEVYLFNENNTLIDHISYNEDMQFELLKSFKGVSLERINPNGPSEDENNFHSAAETECFATPGYQNSQYSLGTSFKGKITISPETFSPDNDGYQDWLNINYQFSLSGFVANVSIFDRQGRLIRKLVNNELLGKKGSFKWDGLNEEQSKSPIGIYLIYFEAFNPNGQKEMFKKTAVLAGRLK